jgi:hypothetical protein
LHYPEPCIAFENAAEAEAMTPAREVMEMACRRLLEADEYGRPRLASLTAAAFGAAARGE